LSARQHHPTEPRQVADAGSLAIAASGTIEGSSESSSALLQRIADLSEQNLQLTEAVATRDAFLAVAAHELRNPMTPIVGRVSMLRHMVAGGRIEPGKLLQSLDQIESLVTMFVKRATTLLDVSRMTSDKLRVARVEVDVVEVAQSVLENFRPLAEHANATLSLDLPPSGLRICGDRLALEQILDNLVSNAIKYAGGTPIVISASVAPHEGRVSIIVRDGGPGISPENQARIFERFERAVKPGTHTGGFGVGLWIVKQLAEAMEGSIVVTSEPGLGSEFCITLPLFEIKEIE
jgi:two-component system OmpR family sensor kinase